MGWHICIDVFIQICNHPGPFFDAVEADAANVDHVRKDALALGQVWRSIFVQRNARDERRVAEAVDGCFAQHKAVTIAISDRNDLPIERVLIGGGEHLTSFRCGLGHHGDKADEEDGDGCRGNVRE